MQFSAPGGKPGAVGQEILAVGATSVAVPAVFRGSSRSYIDVQLRTEWPCNKALSLDSRSAIFHLLSSIFYLPLSQTACCISYFFPSSSSQRR
jgi:hypothetical protein